MSIFTAMVRAAVEAGKSRWRGGMSGIFTGHKKVTSELCMRIFLYYTR